MEGITKASTVHCWGGHVIAAISPPPGEFVQVSSGKDFSCGLRPTGVAQCWGNERRRNTRPPSDVRFKQLSVSSYGHSACGVTLEADVVCWGEKGAWALPLKRGPFAQVTMGNRVTCGLEQDSKRVDCWGLNSVDAARDAAQSGASLDEGEHHAFEALTSGYQHRCGITSLSEVVCWGSKHGPDENAVDVPDSFVVA